MGDVDAIIECRIKQVALHKVLTHLYEFPVKDVVLAQCTLAEAYAIGGYMKQAYGHLSAARETCTAGVHESVSSPEGEETMRLKLQIAEALNADGKHGSALQELKKVVDTLKRSNAFPELLVDALVQLARWLEHQGREGDAEALLALQDAEQIVEASFGKEDAKAVNIKRDVALLSVKLGNHAIALKYLQTVEYLERRLHGSQSANVARTLKALGTVHLATGSLDEAARSLSHALSIFEADYPPNVAIIRDLRAKLIDIASTSQA